MEQQIKSWIKEWLNIKRDMVINDSLLEMIELERGINEGTNIATGDTDIFEITPDEFESSLTELIFG